MDTGNREIRAVIQLCHGMTEYVNRYDEFARWLAEKGYYVTGHDHLGHGQSVLSEEDYGYFPEKRGNECVIGDIRKLFLATKSGIQTVRILCWDTVWGLFAQTVYPELWERAYWCHCDGNRV